jgi:hypothetical protein
MGDDFFLNEPQAVTPDMFELGKGEKQPTKFDDLGESEATAPQPQDPSVDARHVASLLKAVLGD